MAGLQETNALRLMDRILVGKGTGDFVIGTLYMCGKDVELIIKNFYRGCCTVLNSPER